MKDRVVCKGASISTIYTIVMSILKLCGVIEISWFWVFIPQLFGVGLLMLGIGSYFDKR